MKQIILTNGAVAWVDDADYELVSKYKWYPAGYKHRYANAYIPERKKTVFMHVLIMEPIPPGKEVHHKKNNFLDNRRSELEHVTPFDNLNKAGARTGKYKGVSFAKHAKKWTAHISRGGEQKNLGYFETEELAAKAYDKAALVLFGSGTFQNFPSKITPELLAALTNPNFI